MLTFPTHLFRPDSIKVTPVGVTVQGGESLSGEVDLLMTDGGGRWRIELGGIWLNTPDKIRAWRVWEDIFYSGVNRVLVPIADIRQTNRVITGGVEVAPGPLAITGADPYVPEAVAYAVQPVTAVTVGAKALRATSMTVNITKGAPLRGGEFFSIDHATAGRRLYRVGRITARPTGTQATFDVRPPLREAVASDAAVDFSWPSLTCTVAPDADISPEIDRSGTAMVGVVFNESIVKPVL